MTNFNSLSLHTGILLALKEKGYTQATPVQQQTIPHILEGKDIIGCAQTGTGKTAAFCIPVLQRLDRHKQGPVRALILAPTRELALQVSDNLKAYGSHMDLTSTVVFGGVSQFHQVNALRKGIDILVATPGRLLDLIDQRIINLTALEILVLDEADRMLDMGFIHDIRRILKIVPAAKQTILFSATMPPEIKTLADTFLKNPVQVTVGKKTEKININQSVYYVPKDKKRALLKHIIKERQIENAIVFARTKHGADRLAKDLLKSGISAESFHGDKSQNARIQALSNFKRNITRVLVATDIAARGIDIADLPYVINFELPDSVETYTHRIGRTGRAGSTGHAVSLCDHDEKGQLKNINKTLTENLRVMEHPFA